MLAKDHAVLKPGDLASGWGIKFSKYFTEETWQEEIKAATASPKEWVTQELCYLKKSKDGRYQDLTVFLADGLARGVTSRISPDEVVNVGQGGLYQAAVLRDNSFLN